MSIIIAIKCQDGIVIATDGATSVIQDNVEILNNDKTIIYSEQTWIQQKTNDKIEIYDDDFIFGGVGIVVLNKKLAGEFYQLYISNNKFIGKSEVQILEKMEFRFKSVLKELVKDVELKSGVKYAFITVFVSNDIPMIMGGKIENNSCLMDKNLDYIVNGWGEAIAGSFMAFMQKYYWKANIPTLNEGVFSVVFSIKQAINFSALKLSLPIHISILQKTNNKWNTRRINDSELNEVNKKLSELEQYLINL